MKTVATALFRHTHWMAFSLLVFLLSGLVLPNLASAQYIYTIETTTGKNGTDKPVYIVMIGTKGGMEEEFKLDAPGDDFKWNATNTFTYASDKDFGDITDIALKANPQDHWEVKKVTVKQDRSSITSTWTAFRGGLIKGEWTNFFRADGLTGIKEKVSCCGIEKKLISTKIESLDNLINPNDDTKRRPVPTENTVTGKVSLENTNRNSVNNSLNINTSMSYEPFPGGPSFSTEIAYGLEVQNEITRALTKETSYSLTTQDKRIDLVAPPGSIQYCVIRNTEVRKKGQIKFSDSESPEFSKVIANEYDISYYTYTKDNLDEIPEFIIKEKGRPFYNEPENNTVRENPAPVPPSPQSQPQAVVENSATSQVEVCDNAGNVVGYFKENGNGWVETDTNGNTKFRFRETSRDQGMINLSDTGRPGVNINLDLNNREVLYSDQNNTTPFSIYVISKIN